MEYRHGMLAKKEAEIYWDVILACEIGIPTVTLATDPALMRSAD